MRKTLLRLMAASLLVAFILPGAAGAQSAEPSTTSKVVAGTFDVLLLRPLQTVATLIGFGFFVPAAVMTSPGGMDSISDAWEVFVVPSGRDAFLRPIGDF